MFTISLPAESAMAGSIGFWETTWQGEQIYETGWMVLPEYAGRGIATQAAAAIAARARGIGKHRFLHAFPNVLNAASNAVCQKAGFTNMGQCTFEYPKRSFMQCHNWRIDLFGDAGS
jgi:RimJ/RimL family protein N-acetyltransferase